MPRRPRLRLAGIPFHVIQRGNNRSACFLSEADYRRYLRDLLVQSRAHGVAVHAYVLMTNHAHLLMTPDKDDGIGLAMKFLGQRYVQYFNRKHHRSGTLWEGRFRSCLVDSEGYLLWCHQYIESNPVRAGMVGHAGDYPWSSYRFNAQGVPNALLTVHPSLEALGNTAEGRRTAYRAMFPRELDAGLLAQIRGATNGGFALGSERFKREVARTLGRVVTPRKKGPKARSQQ